VTFPGLVGCLSGMNDAGLAVAILEVFQVKAGKKRLDRSGMPYALCYRRLLESCSTRAEAKKMLESMPRTKITNLAVADSEGVAIFEVTPREVRMREAVDGVCMSTNHFSTPELRPVVRLNVFHTSDRIRALAQSSHGVELLDFAAVQHCLDAAHMTDTLQSMI